MQEHWYVEVPEIWSSSHLLPNIYKSVLWSHPQHLHVPLHVSSYKLVEKRDLWDSWLTSHHALTTVKSQWSILLNTKKHFKRKKKIFVGTENLDIVCVCISVSVRHAYMCVCMCGIHVCPRGRNESVYSTFFTVFQTHFACLSKCHPYQMLTCKFWLQRRENQCDTNKFSSTRQSQIIPKSEVTPHPKIQAAHTICHRAAQGASLARHLTSISGIGIVSITRPFTSQLTHAMKLAPCLVHNLR